MRTSVRRAADVYSSTDQLTTGEAAKLLNCSRQHVVDLCERGLLPYTSVGTHRRVERRDVEAIRTRTDRLSREERRSLWLAYAVAGRIVAEPELTIERARAQLERMRPHSTGQAKEWLDDWEDLLDGPVHDLLVGLTDRSLRGREMRQNSPFAGALSDSERDQVLAAWSEADSNGPRRTLTRIVQATDRELAIAEIASPNRSLGLPETPLGRLLRQRRKAIIQAAEARRAHNVRVFGSVARGDAVESSDVDLLVDLDEGVGLLDLIGLERELSELLGVDVDVVPERALKPRMRKRVLHEAVPL